MCDKFSGEVEDDTFPFRYDSKQYDLKQPNFEFTSIISKSVGYSYIQKYRLQIDPGEEAAIVYLVECDNT